MVHHVLFAFALVSVGCILSMVFSGVFKGLQALDKVLGELD